MDDITLNPGKANGFSQERQREELMMEKPVENEMEPSTANIIVNKLRAVGNDFKSFDPRVLRGE